MPNATQKIDRNGHYTAFKGLTVVADCFENNRDFCKKIFHQLTTHTNIPKYFSPLPPESLHMTTINLYSDYDVDNWSDFINAEKTYFREIQELLATNACDLDVSVKSIINNGVIQLIVELAPKQVDFIKKMAQTLGIINNVPSNFHITLAYQYKEIPNEVAHELQQSIKKIILDELVPINCKLRLKPPALCYFKDMTSFNKWNGTSNPFEQQQKPPEPKETIMGNFLQFFYETNATKPASGYQFKA